MAEEIKEETESQGTREAKDASAQTHPEAARVVEAAPGQAASEAAEPADAKKPATLYDETGGMAGEARPEGGEAPLACQLKSAFAHKDREPGSLHDETGGMAGEGPERNFGDMLSPYRGGTGLYICCGGIIGLVVGWLIALAAGINPWGGVVAGAIGGAAIGLYVAETRRF